MAIGDGVSAIAQLAMTFGGFSPTAMDGVEATREQIKRVQEIQVKRNEVNERRREIERARASTAKSFTDEMGSTWRYVVMDGSFVRVDKCFKETSLARIPAEIEGLPVRALGSDIFNESDVVEEIICPDSVEVIGPCAFRNCARLARVVFPASLASYSGSWLQNCDSIREITLPGLLDEIIPSIFDNPSLRVLHIGSSVSSVKPGACERSNLETVTVSDNPYLWCDGNAMYTADKKRLVALMRPVEELTVLDGCLELSKKCCMGFSQLKRVTLPDSLLTIGEFSFAHTGLESLAIPQYVQTIGTRAFFHCSKLTAVKLNDGLKSIEDSSFAESGLESIRIPASVEQLGNSITANSNVVHSGAVCTFEISPDSKSFYFDGQGGLYRLEGKGMHFIQLVDRAATEYQVVEGTTEIAEYAFAFHENIEQVSLPEGLRSIKKNAFRICRNLARVQFPESLVDIGQEAFLDTQLEKVYLPRGFEELSEDALITAGAHRLSQPPSLRAICVHEENESYYVESGLLCRRGEDGDRAIVFNDAVSDVIIPDNVTTIAPFAFSNARNIKTFSIGPKLKTIGTSGFSTWCAINRIHIELAEPLEGRSVFDIEFPDTPKTAHKISISLGGSSWVNVPDIISHYDNCLANAHDYHARESEGISAYNQVKLMLERLNDPIMLTKVNESVFRRTIREHLIEICVDVVRHDDRDVMNDLFEFGALNEDNLEMVIAEVARLQDAAMTGYLLEQKRVRYNRQAIDFDL